MVSSSDVPRADVVVLASRDAPGRSVALGSARRWSCKESSGAPQGRKVCVLDEAEVRVLHEDIADHDEAFTLAWTEGTESEDDGGVLEAIAASCDRRRLARSVTASATSPLPPQLSLERACLWRRRVPVGTASGGAPDERRGAAQ